jgi:hypothetical protein
LHLPKLIEYTLKTCYNSSLAKSDDDELIEVVRKPGTQSLSIFGNSPEVTRLYLPAKFIFDKSLDLQLSLVAFDGNREQGSNSAEESLIFNSTIILRRAGIVQQHLKSRIFGDN